MLVPISAANVTYSPAAMPIEKKKNGIESKIAKVAIKMRRPRVFVSPNRRQNRRAEVRHGQQIRK